MRKSNIRGSKLNINGKSNADLISRFVAEEVYEERLTRFDEADKVEIKKKSNKLTKIVLILSVIAIVLIGAIIAVLYLLNRPEPPLVYARDIYEPSIPEIAAPEELSYDQATDKVLTASDLSSINVKAIYSFSPDISKVFALKNQDQELPVASLTKIMTALASQDFFAADDLVCVKEETRLYGSIDLLKDDCFLRDELVVHMLISSSNDAAEQFRLSASAENADLVAIMNEKTGDYNLDQTKYSNTIGLDDANNYSSAKNSAMLFTALAKDQLLLKLLTQKEATLRSQNTVNSYKYETTNLLLSERSDVIGGKTGFTSDAGGTLVVMTRKPGWGFSMITVILGAEGNEERFEEMSKLLDLIYDEFNL